MKKIKKTSKTEDGFKKAYDKYREIGIKDCIANGFTKKQAICLVDSFCTIISLVVLANKSKK